MKRFGICGKENSRLVLFFFIVRPLSARFRKQSHERLQFSRTCLPDRSHAEVHAEVQGRDLDDAENLVLGVFEGVPTAKKSVFDLSAGLDRIVLNRRTSAVCLETKTKSEKKSGRQCSTN